MIEREEREEEMDGIVECIGREEDKGKEEIKKVGRVKERYIGKGGKEDGITVGVEEECARNSANI